MPWSWDPLSLSGRARSFEDLAHSQAGSHQTFDHDEDESYEDNDDDDDDDYDVDDDVVNLAMIHSMISSS